MFIKKKSWNVARQQECGVIDIIGGLVSNKQESGAWISNYISWYSAECNYLYMP